MKNCTRHTGILEMVKRLPNSTNGNPRFELRCDGWTFCTKPDAMIAYEIERFIGAVVTVTIGTHYGKCQLQSLTHDGGKTEIVAQLAEQQGWDIYHHPAFATSQAQEDLDYDCDMAGYDFVNNI